MARLSDLPRCPQCWQHRLLGDFIGARGKPVRICVYCREKYAGWDSLSLAERLARITRADAPPRGMVLFTKRSLNRKLGPMPASTSEPATCPKSCALYQAGCYAQYGKMGSHWRGRGTMAHRWLAWPMFLAEVRKIDSGALWRHNEAGDLAGKGSRLDEGKLFELVRANRGRRGFTFTHKHARAHWPALAGANASGFTINLSADTLPEADRLAEEGVAPVAVLLPEDAPVRLKTPAGRRITICPAQTSGMRCTECQLCAIATRKTIVGFRLHGQGAALAGELVRRRLPMAP